MSAFLNTIINGLYYLISAFFLLAILWNFVKTKKAQEAILYGVIMMTFILRLARLK